MSKFNVNRNIDLGDFGQHEATLTGTTGDLGTIDSVVVELRGERTQLVHLLPRDLEADLLVEIEADQMEMLRDQADDRRLDAQMEKAA